MSTRPFGCFVRSAGGLAAVLALSLLAPRAMAADVPISEEARTHFAAGVALLQDPKAPRYEDAYREFKAAYAASPSYKILGNLALCAMKIERDAEAITAYETWLREAGSDITPEERAQAEKDLLTLRTGVVRVTVSSDPPGAVILDVRTPIEGTDVRNLYGAANAPMELGLRRGHHVISARLPGYVEQRWEFEASGTTLPPHVFTMVRFGSAQPAAPVPEVPRSRPIPTAAYVTGGVSLGLLVTATISGLAAVQKHNDFESLNDGFHVSQAQSVKSSGQTLDILTDVLLAGTILGAAATGYLVVTRPTVERGGSAATARTGPIPRISSDFTLEPLGAHGAVGGGASAIWVY
ncbi:MAG TPA: hypothetical protein VIY73_20830 [Polyangiaceae bacterium]